MKTTLILSVLTAGLVSMATAAENKTLTQKTTQTIEKAGEKSKEIGQSAVTATKNTVNDAIEAVTPDKDARKIGVNLWENRLEIPRSLPPGKTAFVIHNSGKGNHSFEIRGEGLDKKFMLSLSPNETKVMHADLKPGHYTALCPEEGTGHEGMKADLTVK